MTNYPGESSLTGQEAYAYGLREVITSRREQLGDIVGNYEASTASLVSEYSAQLQECATGDALQAFDHMERTVGQHIEWYASSIDGHMQGTAAMLEGMLSAHDAGVLARLRPVTERRINGIGSREYQAILGEASPEARPAMEAIMDNYVRTRTQATAANRVFGYPARTKNYVDRDVALASNDVAKGAIKVTTNPLAHRLTQEIAANNVFGYPARTARYVDQAASMGSTPQACVHIAASVGLSRSPSDYEPVQDRTIRGLAGDNEISSWLDRSGHAVAGGKAPRERVSRVRLALTAVAAFAISAVLTANLYHPGQAHANRAPAAGGQPGASPYPNRTPASPTSPSPSETTPQTAEEYMDSPATDARIQTAVSRFGNVVMTASRNQDGTWGVFDTYCSPYDNPAASTGGWTSHRYTPKPGDDCTRQHNPGYRGGNGTNVSADVLIGSLGQYTQEFVGASVGGSSACVTSFTKSYDGGWEVSITSNYTNPDDDSADAVTVSQAKRIVDKGIACLDETRP